MPSIYEVLNKCQQNPEVTKITWETINKRENRKRKEED